MARRRLLRKWQPAGGAIAVEFALILMGSLALFAPVGEFYRLSLIGQTLARVTHLSARAAAADPDNCESAITYAFQEDRVALWLLDRNNDGRVGVIAGGDAWPDGSADEEVHITVSWDGDLTDTTEWEATPGCGSSGSLIEVRARIVVRPWSRPLDAIWPEGIRQQHQSWSRNQS